MELSGVATFVGAVLLISASPGPAMALILRRASLQGWRAAVPTVLGLEAGLYIWALLAAAGFASLVAASEVAFVVLKSVGAVVLVLLGLRAWREAWRVRRQGRSAVAPSPAALPERPRPWRHAFVEGLVVQLANPKAAVFTVAFYPQFIGPDQPLVALTAALAGLQVVLETGLYLVLAAAAAGAGAWLRAPRIRARVEAATGAVLVALGLRVALSGPSS